MSSSIGQSFAQDAVGNISRPSSYTTGTLSALNAAVTIVVPEGQSSWSVYLNGTFSAASQVSFEGSLDNTNWFYLTGRRNTDATTNDQTTTLDVTPMGGAAPMGANPSNWRGNLAGVRFFRVRCSIYTTSDAIGVQIATGASAGAVFLNAAIPTFADKAGVATITALNGAVAASTAGCSTAVFNVSGTWSATLAVQGTVDGTNWFGILAQVPLNITTNIITTNAQLIVPSGGYSQVRLVATAYTSGTVNVSWEASAGTNVVQVANFTASGLQATARLNDGVGNAITSTTQGAKQRLDVTTGAPLTPASPTAATVGVASASSLATNANRKGLVMTNTSNARISLNIVGGAAVLNSGITLFPGGVWVMDDFTFTTSAIFAIASAASSNLAIQELS